jgi:hypothetical protein
MKAHREADQYRFENEINQSENRNLLKNRVKEIKTEVRDEKIRYIIVPDDLMEWLKREFLADIHKGIISPKDMRDLPRLIRLAKSRALLNFDRRKRVGWKLYVNRQDVEDAIRMYESIRKSTRLGISPEVYKIFTDLIQNKTDPPITRSELAERYHEKYGRPIGYQRVSEIIRLLKSTGLVDEVTGEDRRVKYIRDIFQAKGVENSLPESGQDNAENNDSITPSIDFSKNSTLSDYLPHSYAN